MHLRRSDRLFAANRAFLRELDELSPELAAGDAIEGLIEPREGRLLYTLARRAARLGHVVEIGAFKGRSTYYLARGLEDARSPYRVISIDPHRDERHRRAFLHTIEGHGLGERVVPRRCTSHEAVAGIPSDEPIGMLWVDGDHRYESVAQDLGDWFPLLAEDGWLALHDTVNNWYGPTRLARELLARRSDLTDVGVVFLTLFARKTRARLPNRLRALKGRVAFDLLTLMQARHAGFGAQAR
jgi:predicted O-methyltransferase YrrM